MTNNKMSQFIDLIKSAEHIVYFTGAGVSTQAGIPDFRSQAGLYTQLKKQGMPSPEYMLSRDYFDKDPAGFYDFQWKYMYHNDVDPTLAHYFPVYLENNGKKVTVVTQNADGLHQKSGSSKVLNLHGNQYDFVCQTCGTHYTYDELTLDDDQIPRCPKDNGIIKSTAVLFGDPLDMDTLNEAVHSIAQSDLMIIAGTSL